MTLKELYSEVGHPKDALGELTHNLKMVKAYMKKTNSSFNAAYQYIKQLQQER